MSNNNYDFQEVSNDVEGFWSGEGEIIFRPEHANLSDNKADKSKANVLVIGKLVAPCADLVAAGESVELEPGATVGVWFSAGMRALLQCAGAVTKVERAEDKDKKLEGRPKPMKGYRVSTPKGVRTGMIEVLEDHRKESKNAPTPFNEPKRRAEGMSQVDDDEDVPFA